MLTIQLVKYGEEDEKKGNTPSGGGSTADGGSTAGGGTGNPGGNEEIEL